VPQPVPQSVPQSVPQQPEFNHNHSIDPSGVNNSGVNNSGIDPSLSTENERNFFNNEEIHVSKLPSDIGSSFSKDDIEKLMLTDSDNDENLSELSFNDNVDDDNVDDDNVDDDNVDDDNVDDDNVDDDNVDDDNVDDDKDYTSMTVNELKEILVSNNLPVSGNKTKLIQRIHENK
jgi:hypothetical protein